MDRRLEPGPAGRRPEMIGSVSVVLHLRCVNYRASNVLIAIAGVSPSTILQPEFIGLWGYGQSRRR
jgi:hypothetical protein